MLNQFIFSLLVITVIYNLQKILSESKNLVLSKSNIIERFDTCIPGQGPDGTGGYQCTLGCGSASGGHYPWGSRDAAADACRKRGFAGLCDKNTVFSAARDGDMNQCCLGWTNSLGNDSRGWYQTDQVYGCGGPRAWSSWMRSHAGAHCCGTSESYNALRRTAKSMNIMQTKLSNAEDELHRLSAGELDYNTARQRQEADMQQCRQAIDDRELQRQEDVKAHVQSTIDAQTQAKLDQQIALRSAERRAKLALGAALKANDKAWGNQFDTANTNFHTVINAQADVLGAQDKELLAQKGQNVALLTVANEQAGAAAACSLVGNNTQFGDDDEGDVQDGSVHRTQAVADQAAKDTAAAAAKGYEACLALPRTLQQDCSKFLPTPER